MPAPCALLGAVGTLAARYIGALADPARDNAMPSISARSLLAALFVPAALCMSAGARADSSYAFALLGQMVEAGHTWTWTGKLTIVLDSGADGLYDNDHIVAFDMTSTTGPSFSLSDFSFLPFQIDATVEGGRMTAIDGRHYDWPNSDATTDFSGLSVHYFRPFIDKTPETSGDAVLSPLAVPEPGAGAMLLLGLGLFAWAAARRDGAGASIDSRRADGASTPGARQIATLPVQMS
jgi:hypothetical protein